jgi:ribosome-associated translation inhibitor RaiA
MTTAEIIPVRTWTHGAVPEEAQELAVAKVRSGLRHVVRPVLSARVTLTMSADPAVTHPAVAQATVDVNGRIVRAEAAGPTMRDAIELMAHRLQFRLDRTAQGRVTRRQPARHGRFKIIRW